MSTVSPQERLSCLLLALDAAYAAGKSAQTFADSCVAVQAVAEIRRQVVALCQEIDRGSNHTPLEVACPLQQSSSMSA